MNTDELRKIIWDDLFQAKASKSVAEIAALTDCHALAVRAAVNHDWFSVTDDQISIAVASPQLRDGR